MKLRQKYLHVEAPGMHKLHVSQVVCTGHLWQQKTRFAHCLPCARIHKAQLCIPCACSAIMQAYESCRLFLLLPAAVQVFFARVSTLVPFPCDEGRLLRGAARFPESFHLEKGWGKGVPQPCACRGLHPRDQSKPEATKQFSTYATTSLHSPLRRR